MILPRERVWALRRSLDGARWAWYVRALARLAKRDLEPRYMRSQARDSKPGDLVFAGWW